MCAACIVTLCMCLCVCLHAKSVSLNGFYTCVSMCESACAITVCVRFGDLLCNSALCISVCECVPKLLGALEVCKASSGKFLDTLVQVPQLKLVIPGILEPAKTVETFPSCHWSWIYSVASLPASREHTL